LALDPQGESVAIKKFKNFNEDTSDINEELRVMEELHHENLIKLISVRQNALYTRKNGLSYRCFAIVLEYAAGGELFDFVAETGRFSEKIARTYFHQMMNGIHYMHEKGYAHRDLKPENLLLSDTFVLKIADFGFSCLLKGRDGSGVLKTRLGTEGYMAPEILSKEYDGRKVDIFAAGIILFIIYSGNPPFERATANDPYYKLIKEKRMDLFWESHSRKRKLGFFSQSFRDLFEKMVAFDPCERLSIYDIAKHTWVKNTICTHS
jgi:serine/threonine protein kinase